MPRRWWSWRRILLYKLDYSTFIHSLHTNRRALLPRCSEKKQKRKTPTRSWGFDAVGRGEVVVTARWHYDKRFTRKPTILASTFMGSKAKVGGTTMLFGEHTPVVLVQYRYATCYHASAQHSFNGPPEGPRDDSVYIFFKESVCFCRLRGNEDRNNMEALANILHCTIGATVFHTGATYDAAVRIATESSTYAVHILFNRFCRRGGETDDDDDEEEENS